jgi:predicted nucleotidyltransferase
VCEIRLIGSLAWRGGFGERSDVDLVVRGLGSTEAADLWVRLGEVVDAPIDGIRLEEAPAELRDRTLAQGVALHGTRGYRVSGTSAPIASWS